MGRSVIITKGVILRSVFQMICEQCGMPLTAHNTNPSKGPLARCRGCVSTMAGAILPITNALQQSLENDLLVLLDREVELSTESRYIGPQHLPISHGLRIPA